VYEIYTGEVLDSSSVYRQAYPINAQAVLAIWMKNNRPYIVTDKGEIQEFNGAGFSPIAYFPIRFDGKTLSGVQSGNIQGANRSRPIHPRGVKVHEDSVYININLESEQNDYTVNSKAHSGVWEYNYVTGQLTHRFAFAHTDESFGSSSSAFAYPLLIVDNQYTFLMAGAANQTATTTDNVFMTTSATPQGYFVTKEIQTGTVEAAYESIYHKAKTMADGESIVSQYRTSKRDTVYGTLNWIDETTATTTDDFATVQDGELIRVSHGYAGGDYANITSITKSTNTYTIKVDRSIGATGETSYVFSDNFLRVADTYTQEDGEVKRHGGFGTNPWCQFMVIMKGDIEYRQFISKDNSKKEL